jgi:hypothetical protein
VPLGKLARYTTNGDKFEPEAIVAQYRLVLTNIESGQIVLDKSPLEEKLVAKVEAFRRGQLLTDMEADLVSEDVATYRTEIASQRATLVAELEAARVPPPEHALRAAPRASGFPGMTLKDIRGQCIHMPVSWFGGPSPGSWYVAEVRSWTQFEHVATRVQVYGYKLWFPLDSVTEYMIESEAVDFYDDDDDESRPPPWRS